MYRIPFRRQLQLVTLSAEVAGKFRYIWKNTRKYTIWLSKTYKRIEKIADKKGIDKPKPLVDMEARE